MFVFINDIPCGTRKKILNLNFARIVKFKSRGKEKLRGRRTIYTPKRKARSSLKIIILYKKYFIFQNGYLNLRFQKSFKKYLLFVV